MITADRDTGGVDLRIAGIREARAAFVGTPGGHTVTSAGIRAQEERIAVTAGSQHHRVGRVGADLAGNHIAHHDALGFALDDDQVEHLCAAENLDFTSGHLTAQSLIGTQQQLLTGLASGIEGTGDLRAAERAVRQQSAVFTGKRNTLRHTLVNNAVTDLGQTINIGLTSAEVTALDRVIKQTINTITVTGIVLSGIDTALSRDTVGTARAVLITEARHIVAQLAQGCRGGSSGQTGSHHDHAKFTLVSRIDQLAVFLIVAPLCLKGTRRDFCIKFHCKILSSFLSYLRIPNMQTRGIKHIPANKNSTAALVTTLIYSA